MNIWLLASVALLPPLIASLWVTFRGNTSSRLAGLEFVGVLAVLLLVFLVEGVNRPDFLDIPLALGLLAFGGGMVFVRFLEEKL